jgi:tRNA G18 (ribose-2'-O)-methylase SpoU
MEKSVWNVSRGKWDRLPVAARHRLLATLAETGPDGYQRFLARYEELHRWSELDRYRPPSWLSPAEALDEFRNFHLLLGAPAECEGPIGGDDAPLSWEPRFPVTVALDQVRSPYNVGSVLRLIDNFGLAGLVHASDWLRLDHPRLRRAARGAEQWIPVRCEQDLPSWLAGAGCPVVGLENGPEATPLHRWAAPARVVIVLGNETYGLAGAVRARCSELVSIPMQGYKHSMNVHHALAIAAWAMVSAAKLD